MHCLEPVTVLWTAYGEVSKVLTVTAGGKGSCGADDEILTAGRGSCGEMLIAGGGFCGERLTAGKGACGEMLISGRGSCSEILAAGGGSCEIMVRITPLTDVILHVFDELTGTLDILSKLL